ncbi:MAG: hypothetical protein JNK25_11260 [Phycisphaerae bacterium]|nr:hypothetical protein [Phycisphaerae bacterium]
MKLKGIKPIEQHVDKIVIALTAAAGAGLLIWQFIRPNEVKVGTVKETPTRAFKPVEDAARRLEQRLNVPGVPDEIKVSAGKPVSDQLAIGLAASFGDPAHSIALGPSPSIGAVAGVGPATADTFVLPAIPAPTGLAVHAFRSSIHPVEVVRNPELAKSGLLPSEQPFDKAAVSVEVVFNGQALKDQLLNDPDGDGPHDPIPLGWWRDPVNEAADLLTVVAVQTERETLRNPDGTTPAQPTVTLVTVLPGNTDTLALWNSGVKSIGDVPPYIEQLKAMSEQILRPQYFSTIYGPEWKPPSEVVQTADDEGKARAIESKRRELREIDDKIADLQSRIQSGGDPRSPGRSAPPPPTRGGGGGGGGGKGGGGAGPGGTPPPRDTGTTRETNVKALENQLKAQNERRARVVKTLESMGEKVDLSDQSSGPPTAGSAALGLLDNPEVRIFAHDFAAQPGAQYRYRTRVLINNPLFGRNLQESQKKLGEPKVIEGAWSEWSRPVDVDPDSMYFITSAEGAGPLSPTPRAVAEMFVFHYGFYRSSTVSLEPGDMLIAPKLRLPDDLKIADMKKMEEAMKTSADSTGTPTLPSGPMAPSGPAPGPGKGGPGRGRDGEIMPPIDPRRPAAPAPPSVPTLAMMPEWLSINCPPPSDPRVDSVFLDAARLPAAAQGAMGEGRQRVVALFRDGAGTVVVRSPDDDRGTETYRRLAASAKLGETQGQPKAAPEARTPTLPQPREPRTPPPTKSGGGGGGGG